MAVGLGTDLRSIRQVGMKPMYVGFTVALAVSIFGLVLSLLLVG